MTVTILGIDPGIAGAFVALVDGDLFRILDMPIIKVNGKSKINGYAVRDFLVELGPIERCIIEETGSIPGNAAQAMHNFGLGVGVIHGVLIGLDRPWATVKPQVWTRALGVGSDKGKHRETAQRLFPTSAHYFDRVKDDGRADAALIAHHASSLTKGTQS